MSDNERLISLGKLFDEYAAVKTELAAVEAELHRHVDAFSQASKSIRDLIQPGYAGQKQRPRPDSLASSEEIERLCVQLVEARERHARLADLTKAACGGEL